MIESVGIRLQNITSEQGYGGAWTDDVSKAAVDVHRPRKAEMYVSVNGSIYEMTLKEFISRVTQGKQ